MRAAAVAALAALLLVPAGSRAAAPRGIERVTPADKNDSDAGVNLVQVSADGDSVAFISTGAFADAAGTSSTAQYVAAHGPNGAWGTRSIMPPQAPNTQLQNLISPAVFSAFSPDLTAGIVLTGDPGLTPGAPPAIRNLYLRHDGDGSYELLTAGTPTGPVLPTYKPAFVGASADYRHLIFESTANLVPGASGIFNKLYEWYDGALRLAGILPTGSPAATGSASGSTYRSHVISDDGSRIVFAAPPTSSQLYVRIDGSRTVQVSASQKTVPDPVKPATFQGASADGRYVIFTSAAKLTDDATTGPTSAGVDLYRYDVQTGALADLTVDTADANGATVQGVLGASDDGGTVYFAARGRLETGKGTAGQNNLYVWRAGQPVRYIATLLTSDTANWSNTNTTARSSRVTPDGRHLLFLSAARVLTAYDNGATKQLYRYAVDDGALECVSCDAAMDRATGATALFGGQNGPFIPRAYLPRAISADGSRAFFNTAQALLPEDINGMSDVYAWEDGRLELLSGGKGPYDAFFSDASPSGDDVVFGTRSRLIPQDTDNDIDLYDARVGGGTPAPPVEPVACAGDPCQGMPAAPAALPVAASATFLGDAPAPAPAGSAPAVRIAKVRTVTGTAATLRITVPAAGRISISGSSVASAARSASKAGTYRVRVALTAKARRSLAKRRSLAATLRIAFAPGEGARTTKSVAVTFKQPKAKAKRARRAASAKGGR